MSLSWNLRYECHKKSERCLNCYEYRRNSKEDGNQKNKKYKEMDTKNKMKINKNLDLHFFIYII